MLFAISIAALDGAQLPATGVTSRGIPDIAVQLLKVQIVTGRIDHHLVVKHRDGVRRHRHLRH
jgi:hypothetical protein